MDKESRHELQKIDCNCNDCFFMQRDFDAYKQVTFIPNTCQLETQKCFQHRKEIN